MLRAPDVDGHRAAGAGPRRAARIVEGRQMNRENSAMPQPVTYHDLASRPAETLGRLMPLLGLDYEPAQLKYGEADHRGTLKADYQHASEASAIELDTRWQADLTPEDASAATRHKPLNAYLDGLGLTFGPNGLTLSRPA